ncbi:hypothetical protein RRG08_062526 [Elysia crispata]|uniref:Uncharacterized protein n=1 Tax=Elysia crispata TaxID=231223 RepID=A0AAE0ZCS0_9GAST|nr:hypothetical protein RRG08_062526 [Elysia crispata]
MLVTVTMDTVMKAVILGIEEISVFKNVKLASMELAVLGPVASTVLGSEYQQLIRTRGEQDKTNDSTNITKMCEATHL